MKGGSVPGGQKVCWADQHVRESLGYWIHSSSCCGEALFDHQSPFLSLIESGANHFKFRMLILRCSSHILMPHGLHHRREIPGKGRAFTGSTE